jgi:hypothetical protein
MDARERDYSSLYWTPPFLKIVVLWTTTPTIDPACSGSKGVVPSDHDEPQLLQARDAYFVVQFRESVIWIPGPLYYYNIIIVGISIPGTS